MPKKFLIWTCIILILIISPLVFANSGCWQFNGNYSILMSSVPISPYKVETASFIFSLTDNNGLVKGDTPAKIVFSNPNYKDIILDNLYFDEGILDLKQTFPYSGFYEVIVTLTNENISFDFPYEVKNTRANFILPLTHIFALTVGILCGYTLSKFKKRKQE